MPDLMQHALKPASRATWAQVIATEFFNQLNIAMDEAPPAFDMGFRGE
jgi:hypothetical protein